MASITFAIDENLKNRIERFSWVNWSELTRENLIKKDKLEQLKNRLASREEKLLNQWSVSLGKKAKKGSFKKILSQLPKKEKEILMR